MSLNSIQSNLPTTPAKTTTKATPEATTETATEATTETTTEASTETTTEATEETTSDATTENPWNHLIWIESNQYVIFNLTHIG